MVLPVKRWFAIAFLAGAIAISQATALAADDWQIIKLSGQDYLSVDNISRFYGLPAGIAASGKKVNSEPVRNRRELVGARREGMTKGPGTGWRFPPSKRMERLLA